MRGLAIRQHDITLQTNSALIPREAMTTQRTLHWGKHSELIALQLTQSQPLLCVCVLCAKLVRQFGIKACVVKTLAEGGRMFVDVLGVESFTHFRYDTINLPLCWWAVHMWIWRISCILFGTQTKRFPFNWRSGFLDGGRMWVCVVHCVPCTERNECRVCGFECSTL